MCGGETVTGARATVLLVDDDALVVESLGDFLESEGFATVRFPDGAMAAEALGKLRVDAAIIDLNLPGLSGLDLLARIREELDVPVIMLTAYGDVPKAVDAMRRGAYEFQTKPARPEALLATLRNAFDHHALARENRVLRAATGRCSFAHGIVAVSPAMRRVLAQLTAYPWPGNVRQLTHAVEHAAILASGGVVDELPQLGDGPAASAPGGAGASGVAPLGAPADPTTTPEPPYEAARDSCLAAFETDYLGRLLAECGGNLAAASRSSGIPYRTLHRKLKQAGLQRLDFHPAAPRAVEEP